MSTAKVIRYGAWAAIAVLAFAVAAITMGGFRNTQTGAGGNQIASIGGPFTMVDGKGQPFTEKNLLGKPTVMFFGFTYCPDVCPTTLAELQSWIGELGTDADNLNYVFVSVDPERDTPEVMSNYVDAFDDRIVPLTGSVEQVAKMVKTYRVYAKKVDTKDGSYTMDHSAGVYLLNENNQFVGMISYAEDPGNALAKLKKLAQRTPVS